MRMLGSAGMSPLRWPTPLYEPPHLLQKKRPSLIVLERRRQEQDQATNEGKAEDGAVQTTEVGGLRGQEHIGALEHGLHGGKVDVHGHLHASLRLGEGGPGTHEVVAGWIVKGKGAQNHQWVRDKLST